MHGIMTLHAVCMQISTTPTVAHEPSYVIVAPPQVRREAPSRVPLAQASWVVVAAAPLAGLLLVVGVRWVSTAKVPMVSLGPTPAWVVREAATGQTERPQMALSQVVVQVV
jgi:hypothetical protein